MFYPPNGDVELCWFYDKVGNLKTMSARDIWFGEDARSRRKETVECDSLCLFTCLSHKTLADKVKMGMTLITGMNKEAWQVQAQKAP